VVARPNSAEHEAKYLGNRAFLDTGLAAGEPHGPVHHRTHTQRSAWLSRHRQHRAVLKDYIMLQDAAEVSRYGTVRQFQTRYPAAVVQSQLIDTHLAAIEQHVAAFFAPPSPPPPPPAAGTGS